MSLRSFPGSCVEDAMSIEKWVNETYGYLGLAKPDNLLEAVQGLSSQALRDKFREQVESNGRLTAQVLKYEEIMKDAKIPDWVWRDANEAR